MKNYHNALHIFTGELHGGYIGIDIDNKNNKESFTGFCKAVNIEGGIANTFTCTTPNDGYHYVFKLSQAQQDALTNYKTGQPKLFRYDIDVLYNTGRFVMSGSYYYKKKTWKYKIIDYSKPAVLPDIIFAEIMERCISSKIPVLKNICKCMHLHIFSLILYPKIKTLF